MAAEGRKISFLEAYKLAEAKAYAEDFANETIIGYRDEFSPEELANFVGKIHISDSAIYLTANSRKRHWLTFDLSNTHFTSSHTSVSKESDRMSGQQLRGTAMGRAEYIQSAICK